MGESVRCFSFGSDHRCEQCPVKNNEGSDPRIMKRFDDRVELLYRRYHEVGPEIAKLMINKVAGLPIHQEDVSLVEQAIEIQMNDQCNIK